MNKTAFTLAEILLTLAIIGVVAALTIPAIITKVQQDQYVVGLKKAYNTLKSVEREAVRENGEMLSWTYVDSDTDFEKYFKPHFDILKDCGMGTDDACFSASYANFNGTGVGGIGEANADGSYYKIITSDGISFAYAARTEAFRPSVVYVDVNGKKPPNKRGRDLFTFAFMPRLGGFKPEYTYDANTGEVMPSSVVDADCLTRGYYCAAKVLSEGAMNY